MLPSIEEAWSLPIPAELTSRQGALNTAQAQQVRSSIQIQQTLATLKVLVKFVNAVQLKVLLILLQYVRHFAANIHFYESTMTG